MTARTKPSTGTFNALHNLHFHIDFAGQLASTSGHGCKVLLKVGWFIN